MSLWLDTSKLDQLFPAHIEIDKIGQVVSLGPSLQKHLAEDAIGKPLNQLFRIEFPSKIVSQKTKKGLREIVLTGQRRAKGINLRGSVTDSKIGYIFLLGHSLSDSENADARELGFDDFSPTDSSVDFLFVSKFHKILLNETRALSQDVTQKKVLAEAASMAKSQFLANMSHEIRTPMNGMLGMAQILSNSDLTAKQRELIDIILKSGESLLEILNSILDISKIESGRMTLDRRDENILDVISRTVELHRPMAYEKGLSLSLSFAENCPQIVYIDGLRLGQCFSNLISNAIKFTEKGSVSVHVSFEETGSFYRFKSTITDTGIGISKSVQERLFEPFTQADNSTTRRFGGSGLGLSIARRFAKMMRGNILIESVPGKGSIFTLTFEARSPESIEALSHVA